MRSMCRLARVATLAFLPAFFLGCRHAESPTSSSSSQAQLVVSVVLDQMGSEVLERWWPALDESGALKTLAREGVYHHTVRYAYAGTYTAPGHSAIYSGASPIDSGIGSNRRWDRARQKSLSIADDGANEIFGHSGAFAGPGVLLVDTVGDTLATATHGLGKVVSVSMKDRGAILPGGHKANFVAWYDERAKGFTSSTAYGPALPSWFETWRTENPVSARFGVWNAEKPEECARLSGPDDGVGEGNFDGYGTTFPHDVRVSKNPYDLFLMDPASTELLVDLARRAVDALALGGDEVPDLLAISISGTDYVGHTFGPNSWESLEHLRRADRALGRLLRELRAKTRVAMIVTADHGIAPIPERPDAKHEGPGRLDDATLLPIAQSAAERVAGPGLWVEAFVQPFLYLSPAALQHEKRRGIENAIVDALSNTPGISYASTVADAAARRGARDTLTALVAESATTRQGELMVFTTAGTIVDEKVPRGFGTSHGSPWVYDRTVPVLAAGPGVGHLETHEALLQSAVASSIASLLRVPAPPFAAASPLPGFYQ
jgi:hypothetical protein